MMMSCGNQVRAEREVEAQLQRIGQSGLVVAAGDLSDDRECALMSMTYMVTRSSISSFSSQRRITAVSAKVNKFGSSID